MSIFRKILLSLSIFLVAVLFVTGIGIMLYLKDVYSLLPEVDVLQRYTPALPLRIYSQNKTLLAEFGTQRREYVSLENTPKILRNAVLATEDSRFFNHNGVDFIGVGRALLADMRAKQFKEGASTVTMQLARNVFLTPDKSLHRKLRESLLAFKIEKTLSKDKILEIYLNQVYLGQGSYGFGAASKTYFNKELQAISTGEAAMLAGLLKAPSTSNPLSNPTVAQARMAHVLSRMLELNYITQPEFKSAFFEYVPPPRSTIRSNAEYAVETARLAILAKYGEKAYTDGLDVFLTIDDKHQSKAYSALITGLLNLTGKQGYPGPEARVNIVDPPPYSVTYVESRLGTQPSLSGFEPALVTNISSNAVEIYLRDGSHFLITGEGLKYVKASLHRGTKGVAVGAIVRVRQIDSKPGWQIVPVPQVEGAFVALDSSTGAIKAMVGGVSYSRSAFNRVTQAVRQPGSAFKPFIYSAALEFGINPSSVFSDTLLESVADNQGPNAWNPKNYDGVSGGSFSMRQALYKSKNLVSIRILDRLGIPNALAHLDKFSFDNRKQPADLTLSLGSGAVTPLQMAESYAVFANGGFKTGSYLIDKIVKRASATVLYSNAPILAGDESKRSLDERNAFIMTNMLKDVVHKGTGFEAGRILQRNDIAGKTGTTNSQQDVWFAGFQERGVVAVVWLGHDTPKSLGSGETGGTTALPVWTEYMAFALDTEDEVEVGTPEQVRKLKNGDYVYSENFEDPLDTEEGNITPDTEVPVDSEKPSEGALVNPDDYTPLFLPQLQP